MIHIEIYNLKELDQDDHTDTATLPDEKNEEKEEKIIICKKCQYPVTSHMDIINVNGSHRHDFANPHGYLFEIGCFKKADGCLRAGNTSSEFTWFTGYSWNYAICVNCTEHLGWFFTSKDSSFFGLIIERLLY